ncbi:hypothetical protein Dsui_0204 [Azospira oryzae PS]|uniref:Uncharacterized protein n=1 Tax=Azospira oryzae (strain ATCC BAA-33 / DSM 13638 / PS) TaxID=640081 RepID=G8QMP4_AZOOP|nr:hypothetical protein [Azospira oryzae]AEV24624.1 hypothetical protein Dsui_0204 [Azospira oryzae PS]
MGLPQENEVQVRVSAETSTLKPGMDASAQDVERAAERMRASVSGLKDAIQGHMTTMTTSVKAANDDMAGGFSSMAGVVGRVSGALAAVGAVLAGGAIFHAGVEESKKFTSEANGLAKALGISTTEASALNVALGDIYSSSETFIGASQMLSRQLRTNEEALNNMGLKTRDANGEYRNMKDLMFDAIKVLNGYKEGTDRSLAAQAMFGRGGAEVMAMLKLNNEVVEEAKKKQEELGLIVGVENVAAAKAYKAAMNDVGDVMDALRKAIGDAVMPVLTKLGEWFATIGPAAVTVVKGAIGGLIATFWALKNGVTVVWETINAMVVTVAEPIRALAEAIGRALVGDFTGAKDALVGIPDKIASAWTQAFDEISKSSEETSEKIANLFNRPTDTAQKEAKGKSFTDPTPKKEKKEKVESRMPEWEAQLSQQKAAYMRAHDMYEMSLEDEKKYWDELMATLDTGAKEYGAVRKKSADLELQVLKKKAQEGRAMSQEEVEEWKRSATNGIDVQQQAAEQAFALGQISNEELLDLERQFEQERYDIARQAVEERMALMAKDPNMNPVEYQKLKNQMLEIDRKHALEKRTIENKIQVEAAKPQLTVFKSMETAFSSALTGMLTRAQTFRQALANIFTAISNSFITEMVAKPAAEWAMGLIRQTALYQSFFGTKKAMEAADAVGTVSLKASEAAGVVGANAAEAASGAAASVSSIPYVGWAMAAGVFASTMAMVMGAKSSIPSAEGGWDIPAGATGLMRYHEKEMMLPAKYADVIRGMADGEGNGGGGGASITIQAVDAKSVKRLLMNEGGALVSSLQKQARNFRGVGK